MTCASQAARVSGVVLSDQGEALIGANVYWANTGIGTITDLEGHFSLNTISETNLLVTSYMGYHNDTTRITSRGELTIVLVSDLILDEVTIIQRKLGVIKSRVSAFDTQTLDGAELCKAACCNLSEAFETNASVDVAYADAATGAKTIKMLGLSGTYVQLLHENTPGIRGLGQAFGMEYIPGSWMNSIQVSKGTSSVINGYEATTGQINVEFLKPQTQDPISVNAMLNSELHAEVNVEGGWKIPLADHHHDGDSDSHVHGDHCHHRSLYTGILAHWQQGFMQMDENSDSFYEMPKSTNINLANRWVYHEGDYTFQAFIRGLYDRRIGGQRSDTIDASGNKSPISDPYKIDLRTWRVEGFFKNGYVFNDETGSSLGIITSVSHHNQANQYGHRQWDASQTNAYLNAMVQLNFEGPQPTNPQFRTLDQDHRLNLGLSLNFDDYREHLILPLQATDTILDRYEVTPGIFAEYNLKLAETMSLVAGMRLDYSNRYGLFFTPRLNLRYAPWDWWTIRASAGLGYRSPNAIADNVSMLPSSRTIVLTADPKQEQAVNAGASTTFYIPMGNRELQLSAEYYYTSFLNCLVADMDRSTDAVYLYNLSDLNEAYSRRFQSFAQTAQVEATMEILRGWTITAAFRFTDVKQTTFKYNDNVNANHSGSTALPCANVNVWNPSSANAIANAPTISTPTLRQKPLTNRFKGIITTSYQTPLKKWQFDLTAQFNGGGRMPDGFNDLFIRQLQSSQYYEKDGDLYYKWYPQLMAQITKYWRTCSLYVGAENMTNFRQDNPVLSPSDPYSAGFDASMAWGPITGWKIYVGFRWSLGKED